MYNSQLNKSPINSEIEVDWKRGEYDYMSFRMVKKNVRLQSIWIELAVDVEYSRNSALRVLVE